MKEKLFIFDLNGTILNIRVSKEQSDVAISKITDFLQSRRCEPHNLKPTYPMIQFHVMQLSIVSECKNKIIKKCYSILDEMEFNPSNGITTNDSNVDLLNKLHGKGYHLGIITNNGRIGTLNALNNIKLSTGIFEFIITRDDVKYTKPFPEPYMIILDKLLDCESYMFSDNALDFAPLQLINKKIKMFLVQHTYIKNQSYDWITGQKLNWNELID